MRRPDRVLVVDDQDVICEVLRTLLRREGFDVETARDGRSALENLRAHPYDVMLLDKNLPDLSGLEVLAQSRDLRPELEVIMITGYASLDSALSALQQGAYDYLVKPFADLDEVAERVRRATEKVHLHRENHRLAQDLRARNQLLETTVAELRQTRQQAIAAARLAALGDVAGRLGHELRHPLASLFARLQLLRADAPLYSAALDGALGDLVRLDQLLAEFLDYARPRPIQLAPTDLSALVREVALELHPVAQACGARFELSLPDQVEPLDLDAARLREVLRNLLRNAIEAMPSGGPVEVELAAREGGVDLSVRDRGTGIPLETLPRLGTPFFSTKNGGSGLGLAISRRGAEDHGGRLEIGNREDAQGACARLWLPRRQAQPQP
jgi:signal transduction histidine kinase